MTQQQPAGAIPAFTMGDRLRKAREVTGLDQTDFADQLGVSRGTVSNYERSSTENRKPIVLRAWALATGVPLRWLETGQTETPSPSPGRQEVRDPETALARAARRHRGNGGAPSTKTRYAA